MAALPSFLDLSLAFLSGTALAAAAGGAAVLDDLAMMFKKEGVEEEMTR